MAYGLDSGSRGECARDFAMDDADALSTGNTAHRCHHLDRKSWLSSVPQACILTVIPTDLASGFRYKDGRVLPPLLLQRRGAHPDCKRQHLSSMCAH